MMKKYLLYYQSMHRTNNRRGMRMIYYINVVVMNLGKFM